VSQRVLSLGCEVHHEDVRCVAFDDPVSLADYDAVVVDPASLTALWAGRDAARLGPGERRELAGRLAHLVWRRRSEATEVLRRGGTIVCFLRPLGTPARLVRPGPQGGRVVLHAYSWLPRERALTGLVVASGRSQAVAPTDQAHPAWRLVESAGGGVAEAFVANETLPEGCRVVATNEDGRPVALEVSVGEGKVVFVPPLAGEPDARGRAIVDFFAPPSTPPAETPPPEWLDEALLPGQKELAARLEELEAEIERLEAEFIAARDRQATLSRLNRLVYASRAEELVEPAADAFERLGFDVETIEPHTLKLWSDEGHALVVVAAADGQIDSDPYWALIEQIGRRPTPDVRGVILGNAHCATRPADRPAPFTDLLRRGAQHRQVCLLPTTELYAAVAALIEKDDESLRARLRKAIVSTIGPCELRALLGRGGESASKEAGQ